MTVQLNHTIVPVQDKQASAVFLAEILGLDPPTPFGPFLCVETANGVSLDFDDRGLPERHHYAFLVSEDEFDAIFARITHVDSPIGLTRGTYKRTASTLTEGASTSRIPPVTISRSSPGLMEADLTDMVGR